MQSQSYKYVVLDTRRLHRPHFAETLAEAEALRDELNAQWGFFRYLVEAR